MGAGLVPVLQRRESRSAGWLLRGCGLGGGCLVGRVAELVGMGDGDGVGVGLDGLEGTYGR